MKVVAFLCNRGHEASTALGRSAGFLEGVKLVMSYMKFICSVT